MLNTNFMQKTSIQHHRIQPHRNHVLVQLHDGREDQLVVLPDTAKHQANPFGLVIAVGEGVEAVESGDKLIFMPNAMLIQIVFEQEKFVFVKADQILGKYVPEELNQFAAPSTLLNNP